MNIVEYVALFSMIGNVITVYTTLTVKLEVSKLRGEMFEKFVSKKDHRLVCIHQVQK